MSQRGVDTGGPTAERISRPVATAESGEDLIATIYEVVGASLEAAPDDEPIPIRDEIDPDALAQLFNATDGDAYVSFSVRDRRVTVHSDGTVHVHQFDT